MAIEIIYICTVSILLTVHIFLLVQLSILFFHKNFNMINMSSTEYSESPYIYLKEGTLGFHKNRFGESLFAFLSVLLYL